MTRNTLLLLLTLVITYSCQQSKQQNRLAKASSPYLQEHADNPVDWYEWGEEALQKAKKENKPLLISIGYASCHWCHVMEKESFMDTAVARMMNENFINIKVDREERPDIDNIYMNACQLITGGNGGWPLNAFALPDGKPFFAGTYYTNESWIKLLGDISTAYREKNELVVKQAEALTQGIVQEELSLQTTDSVSTAFTRTGYNSLFDSIYLKIDTVYGGLKGSPKFPMPVIHEFLLQYHYFTGNEKALQVVTNTLSKMALGGMYDHIGGGFARYSTDYEWKVPHFEKMLYDNAQLASLYAHAYQSTKNEWFRNIMQETIGFVERDLASPGGGFYSSINADTEEGEGEFYAWSLDEFQKIEPAGEVAEYYNVLPKGNWKKNRNILYAITSPAVFDAEKKRPPGEFAVQLAKAKEALLAVRNKRNKPTTDTKVLASWNAMMLKAYTDAYAATGTPAYLAKALLVAAFIEKSLLDKDGRLWRNYKDGKASIDGFLDDYAWVAQAWIRLYQVTFDKHWLDLARQVTDYAVANFADGKSGMFYYTRGNSSGLVARKIEISDNVIPSSNAIMAGVLLKLGTYFENTAFLEKSQGMFRKVAGKMKGLTSYYAQWCYLAGLFSHDLYEVAIMGKDAEKRNLELQQHYLPGCIFMGETDEENLPLLENKLPADRTLIYVCTNRICKLPVEKSGQALTQINSKK